MTLKQIADSKEITEELQSKGTLLDTVKTDIQNVPLDKQEEEIFNILKIANRVVKFGEDYETPDFEAGDLAASVLEFTFNLEKVSGVPFTNAAAYLLNIGNYKRMLDISLEGNKRFPEDVEILHKATVAAEGQGDTDTIEMIKQKKETLFDSNPDALFQETRILINNWKSDEAKELIYRYADSKKVLTPKIYSSLFFIYNQGFKDEKTESIAANVLELINTGNDGYQSDPELAYNASLYFILNNSWQNAEIVVNKYRASGSPMTQSIIYEGISAAIISKDIERVKKAIKEFDEYYNKDNTFFNGYSYVYANISNCYAMLRDKNKTLEYLNMAKTNGMDINYVKDMDDYKFLSEDQGFKNLFSDINTPGPDNTENSDNDDFDDDDEDEEEEDEDEGISFEKYAELSAKLDPFENNTKKQKEILSAEGISMEDWEFYKDVWDVEVLTDSSKTQTFAEIYSKFSQK